MLDSTLAEEIHQKVLAITKERDALRIELNYANDTIEELTSQNQEYLGLLIKAEAQEAAVANRLHLKPLNRRAHCEEVKSDWIVGGNWLSSRKNQALLGHVEDCWTKGDYQRALASLDKVLVSDDLTHRTRVDAKLLKSAILRTCGHIEEALTLTEQALQICDRHQKYNLAGKAQFHRGLCYLSLKLPAEASWCFSLAAQAEGHADAVKRHKKDAEEQRRTLPIDDPRRTISPGCKPMPK